jgi:ornithine cyclodeaminase/alanine dehydrogenase-like protein (mu-crystallin family)
MALWLTEQDVRAVLSPSELIDTMERALADFSAGRVVQPVRTAIEIADRSFFAVMPALYPAEEVLGAKLVTVVPANAGRGLHTHLAVVALFDRHTGELRAMLDGRYITEVRTAAVSAVSVRHLARGDASSLAILGSGVQAASHYEALLHVREFRDIRVWSPTPAHRDRFAAERPGVRATATPVEAVRGADVVVVATSSVTPAIESAWVSDGAHVVAIGACRPTQREIDGALVARALLVVDSRAAALQESGDVVQSIAEGRFAADHIRGELGEIVNGTRPGRASGSEVTLFKSLGLAVEDVAAAGVAWRRAFSRGMGAALAI